MDNQSLGVARATGMRVVEKPINPQFPWAQLPTQLWLLPPRLPLRGHPGLESPWPDLVIGTGRPTVAACVAIRRASGGRTFTVHVQDPRAFRGEFDLIITPQHDRLRGANVVHTLGGLHILTPERLQAAAAAFVDRFAGLPHPRIAVLLGGSNRCYAMTPDFGRTLGLQMREMASNTGCSLLVTPSRRTPPAVMAALREALGDVPVFIWDGVGDNPYQAFLALSDALVVTADSVNMVSEACSTGKPVFVAELPGGSRKFRDFHAAMQAGGYTRPFAGRLDAWTYPRLDDVGAAATAILDRLSARASSGSEP